jgi:hypothetical protein
MILMHRSGATVHINAARTVSKWLEARSGRPLSQPEREVAFRIELFVLVLSMRFSRPPAPLDVSIATIRELLERPVVEYSDSFFLLQGYMIGVVIASKQVGTALTLARCTPIWRLVCLYDECSEVGRAVIGVGWKSWCPAG